MNRDLSEAIAALAARCETVVDPGTDPVALAHVLAWGIRPRRGLDALRRRCRDDGGLAHDRRPAAVLLDATSSQIDADDAAAAVAPVAAWAELGCRIALVGDPAYPRRLADGWPQTDPPTLLVRRGDAAAQLPTVAIVGARRASGYGSAVAAWLAEAVARAGGRVVSGGAVGVDAAAHRAACELPGGTTVALGCGHRVAYPRVHARPGGLFDEVVAHAGAIVSELFPDEPPRAGQVRARNRIVAGLADVVVVVEGGARSGSLLTAGAAAERGRSVLAVPGDVRAPGSAAPHRLLQEGAAPCTSPADLLEALGTVTAVGTPATDEPGGRDVVSVLPTEVRELLVAAWPRPVRVDDLAAASGRPTGALLATLTQARVAGELAEGSDGVRLRRMPIES